MRGKVAVLGGYGGIGSHVVRWLHRSGVPLRIGGRRLAAARAFAATALDGMAECRIVDFRVVQSVREFVDGCQVLVNCAGPSRAIAPWVARMAVEAGADYVDAAGDDLLHEQLFPAPYRLRGRTAVLSAGLSPGLTGLFPRAIAAACHADVYAVTVHFQLLDSFTRASADDYLGALADGHTTPHAAWRDGRRRKAALVRRVERTLPFFSGEVTLLPRLTAEDERLARALGLTRGDWYAVVSGARLLSVLDRVRALPREEAAAALCRTSSLDLAGRGPLVKLVVQADGRHAGKPVTRTAVLHGPGKAVLSGAVTALTTLAVLRGQIPPGRHFAADVLDPCAILRDIAGPAGPARVTCTTTAIDAAQRIEEGRQ
ncbi:saccharopine dehydrogenase NADP-binding domain-containing protein [Streptomyces lydicus]|uniref:saccharopine dehydrogenase NADP-binding domain-containing protein n=1 Tax=Streptomyces lydicus TaxID=47763 RepID=UPI0036E8CC07